MIKNQYSDLERTKETGKNHNGELVNDLKRAGNHSNQGYHSFHTMSSCTRILQRLKGPPAFVQTRLKFASFVWENAMWSVETKLNLLGINAAHHVWCRRDAGLHLKNTTPTVMYWGRNILLWCFYSANGRGQVFCIEERMNVVRFWPITVFRETPPSIRALRI